MGSEWDGIHPPTLKLVGAFATEHDAQIWAAHHYPGPEHYVLVEHTGPATWALRVASDR